MEKIAEITKNAEGNVNPTASTAVDPILADIQEKVSILNERLRNAAIADPKAVSVIKRQIAKVVKKSKGYLGLAEDGSAIQVGSSVITAKPPTRRVPGSVRSCPCCNAECRAGSYFRPGHDGRVKSILSGVEKGTVKRAEMSKRLQAMSILWDGDRSLSMRTLAIMTAE